MKKYIFAICDAALILMIPAIFIGYLSNNNITAIHQPEVEQVKAHSSYTNDETSFKPGLVFILKGV